MTQYHQPPSEGGLRKVEQDSFNSLNNVLVRMSCFKTDLKHICRKIKLLKGNDLKKIYFFKYYRFMISVQSCVTQFHNFCLLTNPDWHAESFSDIARYDLGDWQRYRGV